MKILEVIHDFLPGHTAGSEVYTFKLSKEFQKMGHEVSLFFTEADRRAEQYSLRERLYEGLHCYEAVVNRQYSDFRETYENRAMEALFTKVLDMTRPHIIHLQHIINHSIGYTRIARERGIPIVFTLHDYYLTCPLGGQRIRPDLAICHEVDPAICARCVSRYSKNSFRLKRLFEKVSGRLRDPVGLDLAGSLERAEIRTEPGRRVKKGRLRIGNEMREAIVTTGPSVVSFRTRVPEEASLVFATGLKETKPRGAEGEATFSVRIDDKEVFRTEMHPSRAGTCEKNSDNEKAQGAGWAEHSISLETLAGKKIRIDLVTEKGPSGAWSGLTAGWAGVRIDAPSTRGSSPGRGLAARSFLRFNGLFENMAAKKLVPEVRRRRLRILKAAEDIDLFIAPSRFLRDRFIEFGLPEEKILYSDYGFDIELFRRRSPGKSRATRGTRRVCFGYTGSLVPHKGVHVLVKAFRGLDPEKAELRVYGDLTWFPDYVARLREEAGDAAIKFMGSFDNSEVPRVLAGMDVLVVPSIWFENSPLTIHEAFISGTPVITSNLGGMAELVEDGVSGLVFETGNAADLRAKMEAVIEEPGLLARLREGLPGVKTISDDARHMEEIFRDLVSGRRDGMNAWVQG